MKYTTKTDNDFTKEKINLRCDHMPSDPIKVLDCFGGFGVIWDGVKKQSGRSDVERLGIDKERRPSCLRGDNLRWLSSLDLTQFNVIDLDAYGIPFDQVKILFERKYKGTVFFTMIIPSMGNLPSGLPLANGIKKEMYAKSPTIFCKIGWNLWLDYLANNGVEDVWHYSVRKSLGVKHYGCFILK